MKKRQRHKTAEHTLKLDCITAEGLLLEVSSKHPCLVVIGGMNIGERIELNPNSPVTMGRDPGCTVVIRDDGISRYHAQVEPDGQGGFIIRDMNSTNGIFVDGKRIQIRMLKEGEKILLGRRTILKFVHQDKLDMQFQEQMYESSVKDALTGAYNRKHFNERISSEISFANRHKIPLSLLIMDLDHFKNVNDTWGHQAGDQVLMTVSKAMLETLREEDFFARYGGEEFVIIARGINQTGAAALGERVRHLIENLVISTPDGVMIPITVSIGSCTVPPGHETDSTILLKEADTNLYKAKQTGRNRTVTSKL